MIKILSILYGCLLSSVPAKPQILDAEFHHLRNAEPREWSHFPEKAEAVKLALSFDVEDPASVNRLKLRQANVKREWEVFLNGTEIGELNTDDSDLEFEFPIPDGLLKAKGNALRIVPTAGQAPDDIRVGEIELRGAENLMTARVSVSVNVPCRLTIVDAESGTMVLLGARSDDRLAVRSGVIYTLDGKAKFGIRPGRYKIWAGRGFEYSLAEAEIEVKAGETKNVALYLVREVDTSGLVACDAHLHTNEFARHGDATLVERLITIAGEGIELPISTEHDQHIDYLPEAKRIGATKYFTPVLGCEVTTKLGHFNSFPIAAGAPVAKHRLREWLQIFGSIFATPGVQCVIINHPRDVHAGFTPFAPERFDAVAGKFTDGRILKANGLEVINSGAQQSDPMLLVRDWMALLKSGHKIAAVGSSDSHTVNFAIAGQARTYIDCPDEDPSTIDVGAAVRGFLDGKTHVSFGLLTRLEKNADGGVTAKVLGPGWSTAEALTLFVNGEEVERVAIPPASGKRAGEKFEKSWALEGRDGFAVAVAEGPGISAPWWRMMPPYQNTTPEYKPYVMGVSPAVWLGTAR